MNERTSARLAWSLWAVGLVVLVGSIAFSYTVGGGGNYAEASQAVAFFAIGTAGLAVARRQPRNPVGWIYLGVWVAVALLFGALGEYANWATIVHPGAPAGTLTVWLTNWMWVPVFGMLLTFPFLLFPDGHLPSRRWRPVGWAIPVVTALWAASFAFEDAQYTDAADVRVPNPYTTHALAQVANASTSILAFVLIALMGACVASLVIRFRRSRGEERQQIKWLLLAGAVLVVWLLLPVERGNGGVVDAVQGLFLALIPAAVAVGILKYHLYDIDVVIKKTVVFTVVAAVLTALYVGVIAVAALGTISRLLVAVVLFAVTFNPVRRAARSLADRLVYGKRATSYEVLTDFSERMADTYATDDVLPRMAQILAGATGASTATVWLLVDGELRAEASDHDAGIREPVTVSGDVLPVVPDDLAVEVRHQGELLGALSVTMPPNDPMDPGREKLVRDLASQAGLVLRNVRLIEELKASRQRLGGRPGRGATQARAQHPRRGAATARRAHGEGAPGASSWPGRIRRRPRDLLRADPGRHAATRWRIFATSLAASTRRCWPIRASWRRSRPRPVEGSSPRGRRRRRGSATRRRWRRPSISACLEALQNVAKYAGATRRARVAVQR